MSLKDKIVVVTGAAGTMGMAVVRAMLEDGAQVALVDVDALRLDSIVRFLRGTTVAIPCDGISFGCSEVQTNLPVAWLIAITFELRSAANSSPSPMPMPRLPLNGISGVKLHSVAPVAGSSATITPAVVTTNRRPSFSIGVASARSGVSTTQAPPSCLMFRVLI